MTPLQSIVLTLMLASAGAFPVPLYNDGTEYALRNTDINNILKQNKEYVENMGPAFFDDLGSKHQPKYMWIGCADARAPANEIMVRFCLCYSQTKCCEIHSSQRLLTTVDFVG